jgi:TPR repeat protein
MPTSSVDRRFLGLRGLLCFALLGFLQAGDGRASAEVDTLVQRAALGDRAALDGLVELAGKKKDADAGYALGLMAYEGRGLKRNAEQAFRLVQRAAKAGHGEAANTLGYFYEHGIGTKADTVLALESYRLGAETGSARARSNLGWFYEKGIAVRKDPAAAAEWYKLAAEQGLAAAHANLAHLYESGEGVARNPIIAIALYERAVAGGVAPAALPLGRLLEERGRVADAADAYITAAKALVPEADLAAGRTLLAATNTRRNVEQGVSWLEKSASTGKAEALWRLADLFEKGDGVPRDLQRAAEYRKRAASRQ